VDEYIDVWKLVDEDQIRWGKMRLEYNFSNFANSQQCYIVVLHHRHPEYPHQYVFGRESRFFTNNGVRIHYRLYGSGPVPVFVHGHPDNEMTFEHQIDEFSKDHTVILPTVRGYLPSDVPLDENAYDGNVMAGDLLALVDHLGFEKAIFAGGDVGGILVRNWPSSIKRD
jgi:hypothetical protein